LFGHRPLLRQNQWLTPVRFGHIEVTELDIGCPLISAAADGSIQPRRYGLVVSEVNSDAVFGRRSGVASNTIFPCL
jgi:hypothetical protein